MPRRCAARANRNCLQVSDIHRPHAGFWRTATPSVKRAIRLRWIRLLRAAMTTAVLAAPTFAFAQAAELQAQPGQFQLKLSGFQNLDLSDASANSVGAISRSEGLSTG